MILSKILKINEMFLSKILRAFLQQDSLQLSTENTEHLLFIVYERWLLRLPM